MRKRIADYPSQRIASGQRVRIAAEATGPSMAEIAGRTGRVPDVTCLAWTPYGPGYWVDLDATERAGEQMVRIVSCQWVVPLGADEASERLG